MAPPCSTTIDDGSWSSRTPDSSHTALVLRRSTGTTAMARSSTDINSAIIGDTVAFTFSVTLCACVWKFRHSSRASSSRHCALATRFIANFMSTEYRGRRSFGAGGKLGDSLSMTVVFATVGDVTREENDDEGCRAKRAFGAWVSPEMIPHRTPITPPWEEKNYVSSKLLCHFFDKVEAKNDRKKFVWKRKTGTGQKLMEKTCFRTGYPQFLSLNS